VACQRTIWFVVLVEIQVIVSDLENTNETRDYKMFFEVLMNDNAIVVCCDEVAARFLMGCKEDCC
jgi:hypothetical protein